MDGTVLVADDDRTIRTVLTQALTRAGCKVHATASLVTLMRWIDEGKGDLVVSDVIMPDGNGLEMLPKITEKRPGLPVIVISAQNTIMTAIKAEEAQAFDYLPKPFDLPDLMKRAARVLGQNRRSPLVKPQSEKKDKGSVDLPLIGRTAQMQALYKLVARVMNSEMAVMITGESGTGKSLLARSIHDLSDRRTLPFVVASASDFDTVDGPAAALAKAKGGTLLLEEVGDMPEAVQAKIVRMLDTLGNAMPRIMVTSQKDLSERLETGTFRADLYYRLTGVTIVVPPLRERVDDIPLLIRHFLLRAEREGLCEKWFSDAAIETLRRFPWPGNVRQLENAVRHLLLTSAHDEIIPSEVQQLLDGPKPLRFEGIAQNGEKLGQSVAKHLRRYFDLHGGQLPPPGLHQRILREIEVPLIEIALEATSGNQARCADLLGINRNTLRKKIIELDIQVTRNRKLM